VQKGKITVNGTALIEQALIYPINGSVTVVHDGGEVKSYIYDNTLVIYAQNTTIFSVVLNGD
jgi:regulator of RNase E activity RraA